MDSMRISLSFYGGTLGQTNAMGEDSFWNIEEIVICVTVWRIGGSLYYILPYIMHYMLEFVVYQKFTDASNSIKA